MVNNFKFDKILNDFDKTRHIQIMKIVVKFTCSQY